ncbi:unnamed protein product [Bemisia tabaci]|uniref:Glucosamine 6-phosphate N-acetyltransferase n=1 Tax=Bemisia tabaci TaxID=7038 RepID=A0A9P0F9K0_BEMTA|nr:unnamed protein product [Bemisia tabaci]
MDTDFENLFDDGMLKLIDFSKHTSQFSPPISPNNPGDNLKLRPLNVNDYHKGYIGLLAKLTSTGDVTFDQFKKRFSQMKQCPNTYYIAVVEDLETNTIVATTTLVIEQKFIHECGIRGRIEDVVVCDTKRGKQLGKLMIGTMTALAEYLKVYKVSLECKDSLVPFYGQFGYKKEANNSNYLQLRL